MGCETGDLIREAADLAPFILTLDYVDFSSSEHGGEGDSNRV
jgi:hypothetical protein